MLRSPTVVHLHPTRIAENRVPRADSAAVVSYRDRPVGESRIILKALFPKSSRPFAAFLTWRIRRTASRPNTFARAGDGKFGVHPQARPLLAAFATIAAMI